ncbi:hypothetical protein ACKWTF_008794 [Chironomus riparius]
MDKNLRSAAVVIVPFDKFGITYAESLINHNSKSTVFQHTAKVLVIVPKEVMIRDRFQGLKKLMTLGFLNVISVHETAAHDIRFETYLNLNLEPSQELNDFDTNLIIPDKLIQMTAVRYQIVVYHQIPRLVFINGLPKTRGSRIPVPVKFRESGTGTGMMSGNGNIPGNQQNKVNSYTYTMYFI